MLPCGSHHPRIQAGRNRYNLHPSIYRPYATEEDVMTFLRFIGFHTLLCLAATYLPVSVPERRKDVYRLLKLIGWNGTYLSGQACDGPMYPGRCFVLTQISTFQHNAWSSHISDSCWVHCSHLLVSQDATVPGGAHIACNHVECG